MTNGVPLGRVVAVIAEMPDDRVRWGSGFLITRDLVLTAWHCTVDEDSRRPLPLQVQRWTPGGWQVATVSQENRLQSFVRNDGPGHRWGLDIALLTVRDAPWAAEVWASPPFAEIARSGAPILECTAVGYPRWALARDQTLDTFQVEGEIRPAEGARGGTFLMRDHRVGALPPPRQLSADQRESGSLWGGISGAAVFCDGRIVGHVVAHQPHRGTNPLLVVPIEEVVRSTLRNAATIRAGLGLTSQPHLARADDPPDPIDVLDFPFRLGEGGADPCGLLRASGAVVAFTGTARQRDLDEIHQWARSPDSPPVRVIAADAGLGKTRLAMETCQRLEREGWLAGFVSPAARDLARLAGPHRDRFIVLDDAVAHLDQLGALLGAVVLANSESKLRVLVLTRHEGLIPVLNLLEPYRRRMSAEAPIRLADLAADDRGAVYGAALRGFGQRLGLPDPPDADVRRVPEAKDYFTLLASAFLDIMGKPTPAGAPTDVLSRIVASEADWWAHRAREAGLVLERATLQDVVALSCLVVPQAQTARARLARAQAALRLLPTLAEEPDESLTRIICWEQGLYGGEEALNPVRPHVLASHLATDLVARTPGLLSQVLAPSGQVRADAAQVVRVLTTLLPVAPSSDAVRAELGQAMRQQLDALVDLAIAQSAALPVGSGQGTSRALSLEAVLASALDQVQVPEAAAAVVRRLPVDRNLALDDLTLALQRQEVTHLQAQLAYALRNLSRKTADIALLRRGQQEAALTAAWQSVALLVDSAPVGTDRLSAPALPPQVLGEAGEDPCSAPEERRRAATALNTATDRLVAAAGSLPPARCCDTVLADALSNLAVRLMEIDGRTAALTAAQAALTRLPPACQHPPCQRVRAEVQSNLAHALKDAGHLHRATQVADSAITAFRELYYGDPSAFRGHLGVAHRRYARCLAETGQMGEAARHGQRAVDLFRTAASMDANRWRPDQAIAELKLAEWLIELEQFDEAEKSQKLAAKRWHELSSMTLVDYGDRLARAAMLEARILTRLARATRDRQEGLTHLAGAARCASEAVDGMAAAARHAPGLWDSLAETLIQRSATWAARAALDTAGETQVWQEAAVSDARLACGYLQALALVEPAFNRALCRAALDLARRRAEGGLSPDPAVVELVRSALEGAPGEPADAQALRSHVASVADGLRRSGPPGLAELGEVLVRDLGLGAEQKPADLRREPVNALPT